MFKLVIQDDEGKTTVVPLIRDEITIGRKEGNTIRLTERNVSRRHARIVRNNGEVQIEDLGSYNGIRVNNSRIAERVALRISDQVQIGDYKLYLKAEGVEQVDDARTMPVERVDGAEAQQLNSSQTPTQPLGVPQAQVNGAANGLAAPQLVGSPNRTQVAIADTDPAGRPVANAAAVAALTAPAAFGKLVVLSSNFAGKEYDLTRPQMILGRTDENDVVINHSSISRNHAKVVRDRDTGRYTISDLQSANGVRVNGQDYSQVELRRGDTIDLGHVRLRFVEPGEDFVFSAAQIADVPDASGSKKGTLVAVVLGIVVLGGAGVYFLTRKDDKPQQGATDPGSADTRPAITGSGTGAENAGTGSDQLAVVEVPDAAPAIVNPSERGADSCQQLQSDRKWVDLKECAATITDTAKGKEIAELAVAENKAEAITRDVGDLAKKGKLKDAAVQLKKIPDGSVYRREAQDTYDNAAGVAEEELNRKYAAAVAEHQCSLAKSYIREANTNGVSTAGATAACTNAAVATVPKNPPPDVRPKDPVAPDITPQQPECDPAGLKQKGQDYLSGGMEAAALAQFELALKCKQDTGVVKLAYMAACRAKNAPKAKAFFARIPQRDQGQLLQMCVRVGINPE